MYSFSFFKISIILKLRSQENIRESFSFNSIVWFFCYSLFEKFALFLSLYFCFISRMFKIWVTDRLFVEINFQNMLYHTNYTIYIYHFSSFLNGIWYFKP